jgi:hypothetical protein
MMAGEAIFLGWGQVVRGREQLALQVFQDTAEYWAKLQQDGKIESFRPFLLRPHGGDLAGFWLIHGERAALDEIQSSEEFVRLLGRAGAIVDNLGVTAAVTDEALGSQMGTYAEVARDLPQAT